MRRTRAVLCWKPTMPVTADPKRIAELGLRPLKGNAYSFNEADVHPDLHWTRRDLQRKGKTFAFSPEQQLTDKGFYADVANEAMLVGLDRSNVEQKKRGLVRGMMTQGGHGPHGSEFSVEDSSSRGMPDNTHQFKMRKRTLHSDWDVVRWEGKFQSLCRTFRFDTTRFPYFLYNRLNDRVIVDRKHYPIEIMLKGNTCVIYLTTTYSQGVSELDFTLATFLDKERQLMDRPDWTPVVRRTNSDGTKTYDFETPEAHDLSDVDTASDLQSYAKGLVCDWEVLQYDGAPCIKVRHILHSWSRVMDVVNSVMELSESAKEYPACVTVNVDTVTVHLRDTPAGRYIARCIDTIIVHHESYLSDNWARSTHHFKGSVTNRTKAHLADTNPTPTAHFLKNPIGKGMGPIRKVLFEKPADEEAHQKRVAWGGGVGVPPPGGSTVHPSSRFRDASQGDASQRAKYKHNPNVLDQLRQDLQKSERLKKEPVLE
eukprot:TRINITY_DN31722_c0_g1_i1.p1 TRINITY_DN31722_c0_g1~~TRINITY_DN31722_c0_g1_i1.p1  ORF type:complete len:523 (+),score=157.90 TRINITY_DN31722_c0_g1_i1:119-1570(+)